MVSSTDSTFFLWNSLFIEICESSISKKNECIHIDLDLDIRCLSVRENQSLTFTPMLINDNYHHELPAIIICGKNRFKAYRKWKMFSRVLSFESDYNIYAVLSARNGELVSLSYTFKTPIQKWMSEVTLGFYDHLKGQIQTM